MDARRPSLEGTAPVTRRATMNDLPVLGPLFSAYRTFYGQEENLPKCFAFLRERLTLKDSTIFIADHEGAPAGFCQLYPFFSSVRMCRAWVLNDLFVAESHRRSGVGGVLMETAETYAREQIAGVMMLETAEDNAAAQALYESRGWVQEEGTRHYALKLRDDV